MRDGFQSLGLNSRLIFRISLIFVLGGVIWFCFLIYYKGNQPMRVDQTPTGMTYWQFMSDRLNAAKVLKPARCGYGMFGFYALTVPFYSVLYTYVGLHPDSFLAKVTAKDANIPMNVQGTPWYGVLDLWWNVVERLSWSSLARPGPGCNLGPLRQVRK